MTTCLECENQVLPGRKCCSTRCAHLYASHKAAEIAHRKKLERDAFNAAQPDVVKICHGCGNTFTTKFTDWHCTCSEECSHLAQAKAVRQKMLNDNPMKRPEIRAKVSKTRKEKFANDPEFKEMIAECTRQAWADGKYDDVPVGKCKWYDHVKPSGEIVKLQGTWEVAVARYFDANEIDYVAHRGRFSYVTPDGAKRSYLPDFFLPLTNEHVDVKGAFWSFEQRDKLDHIRNSNPSMKLVIYDKKKLEDLNIDYVSVQKELL